MLGDFFFSNNYPFLDVSYGILKSVTDDILGAEWRVIHPLRTQLLSNYWYSNT